MPNIETEVTNRIQAKLAATAPGFDPLMITTLIETLMDLLSNLCGGDKPTPAQAVDRVQSLTPFQRAALRAKLARKAREKGIQEARRVAPLAADAVEAVARESTPEERLAFASYLLPLSGDSFDIF